MLSQVHDGAVVLEGSSVNQWDPVFQTRSLRGCERPGPQLMLSQVVMVRVSSVGQSVTDLNGLE